MAKSFAKVPDLIVFTTGAADVVTRVSLPNAGRKVSLYFETDPGKFALSGTDGEAIVAAYGPVIANNWFVLAMDRDADEGAKGPGDIYITTAAGATVVRMLVEAL